MSTEIQVNNSHLASGFKNYYILGVNMHYFEKTSISRDIFWLSVFLMLYILEMHGSKISALNLKALLFHCASLYENQYYTMQAKLQLLHQNCNELSMGPMQGAEKKVVPVRPIKI